MRAHLTVHEDRPPVELNSLAEADARISAAAGEARLLARPNIVFVRALNGNEVSFVVGETETVLGFTFGHGDPPYYVSKGLDGGVEPVFTAFVSLTHHTEYPRNCVIPWCEGLGAVHQFIESGELPSAVAWQEV